MTKIDLLLGGIPRSGTTALARGVGLHPEVFCWSSESALLPMMEQLTHGLPMRPENRPAVEQMMTRHLKSAVIDQRDWHRTTAGFTPPVEIGLEAIEGLASRTAGILGQGMPRVQTLQESASLLREFFAQFTDRRLVAEKSPSNVLLIPDGLCVARRWLLTHRDPFATIASMQQRSKADPWAEVMGGEIEQRIGLYVRHARGILHAREHPNEVMVLNLDQLATNPAGSLATVCLFLRIEPTLSFLDQVRSIIGGQPSRAAWERFSPLDRWKVLHLCADEMRGLGYSQHYYQVSFSELTRRTPRRVKGRIEPLYGVFSAPAGDRLRWMQRTACTAIYLPRGVNRLVLRVYNLTSPLIGALHSHGLNVADLKVSAHSMGGGKSRVTLSELSLAKDFCADWAIDLRRAEPVGHHGEWRLVRVDFETNFAYTPCCTLANASDERTFSFGILDWQLDT